MPETEMLAQIEDMTRLRGWIANSYAQIEYLLGDLIIRARSWPEYEAQTATFTHKATKRVSKVRAMAALDGPLSEFADALIAILDRFDRGHDTRNLLAHGFCEFHRARNGETGMQFQRFDRQPNRDDALVIRLFRPADLESEKIEFTNLAHEAVDLFITIHRHFGWVGFVPDTGHR